LARRKSTPDSRNQTQKTDGDGAARLKIEKKEERGKKVFAKGDYPEASTARAFPCTRGREECAQDSSPIPCMARYESTSTGLDFLAF
jgi:hypothetical protein